MKLKKGTINVVVWPDSKEIKVKGLKSAFFGVHRQIVSAGNSDTNGGFKQGRAFTVTHLPTGLRLLELDTQNQARKFMERLETGEFPTPWNTKDTRALVKNTEQTRKIALEIEN